MIQFIATVDQGKITIPEEYSSMIANNSEIEVIIKPMLPRLMDQLAQNPLIAEGWRNLNRDEIHEESHV